MNGPVIVDGPSTPPPLNPHIAARDSWLAAAEQNFTLIRESTDPASSAALSDIVRAAVEVARLHHEILVHEERPL